jgi:hypothetical protein
MLNEELVLTNTAQLAAQAREAYEQKRIRECMALARQLAQADPGNAEAETLQSAIRADIQQDLHDARSLLEQSGTQDEKRKYRKAAEIILIKALSIDPENQEANILLQSARGMSSAAPATPAAKPPKQTQSQQHKEKKEKEEEVPFVAASTLFENFEKKDKKSGLKLPLGLIAVILLGGGLIRIVLEHRTSPDVLAAPVVKAESALPADYQARAETPAPAPAAPAAAGPASPTPVAGLVTPAATAPAPATAVPAVEMGQLVVNSAMPAEIYQGDKLLGTTPATLQLPVGRQTLEYRRGDLRTVVNHTIKANEATNASITFQATVQINAKPWAQVFLDGLPRRALGQTPLSGVNVPVGGVLVFENPNFTAKSYRITDKDTAIQVDFP